MVLCGSLERRGNTLTKFYNSVLALFVFRNKPMQNIRRLIHLLLRVSRHHVYLSFHLPVAESSVEDTLGNIVLTESLDFRLSNF